MRYAQILGTGSYVPDQRLTNAEVDARFGEEICAGLVEHVGIQARHYMAQDQTTSDLAAHAARRALAAAGVEPMGIDHVLVATDTPDGFSPATAYDSGHDGQLGAAD